MQNLFIQSIDHYSVTTTTPTTTNSEILNCTTIVDVACIDTKRNVTNNSNKNSNSNTNHHHSNEQLRIVLTQNGQLYSCQQQEQVGDNVISSSSTIITTTTTTPSSILESNNNNNNDDVKILWNCNLNDVLPIEVKSETDQQYNNNSNNNNDWFQLTILEEENCIVCLSSTTGAIVTVSMNSMNNTNDTTHNQQSQQNNNNMNLELVGQFDNGICAACWNISKDILAIITYVNDDTGTDTDTETDTKIDTTTTTRHIVLLIMNTQFDVLDEIVIGKEYMYTCTEQQQKQGLENQQQQQQQQQYYSPEPIHIRWNETGTAIAISCVIDEETNTNDTKTKPSDLRKIRIYSWNDKSNNNTSTTTNQEINNNIDDNDDDDDNNQDNTATTSSMLQLQCIGTNEDGIGKHISNIVSECTIDWANSNTSNVLTSIQRKGPLVYQIIFLEPNGLRHGQLLIRTGNYYNSTMNNTYESKQQQQQQQSQNEISSSLSSSNDIVVLPKNNMKLINVKFHTIRWNPIICDLLCILFQEMYINDNDNNDQQQDDTTIQTVLVTVITKLQLYTRSNYYWYLKQELCLNHTTTTNNTASDIVYDVQFLHTNHIAVIKKQKQSEQQQQLDTSSSSSSSSSSILEWTEYVFRWDTSTVRSTNTTCLAFVTDGTILHITNFLQSLIPPPMCGHKLICTIPIINIIVNYNNNTDTTTDTSTEVVAVLIFADYSFAILGYRHTEQDNDNKKRILTYPTILARSDNKYLSSSLFLDGNNSNNVRIHELYLPAIVQVTENYIQILALASISTSTTISSVSPTRNTSSSNIPVICTIQWQQQQQQQQQLQHENVENECQVSVVQVQTNKNNNNKRIISIASWIDGGSGAIVELNDGTLLEYDTVSSTMCPMQSSSSSYNDHNEVLDHNHTSFLEPCLWITSIKEPSKFGTATTQISASNYENDDNNNNNNNNDLNQSRPQRLVVGMSTQGRLYCYDILISDSVSSYFVSLHHDYVCYTSTVPITNAIPASRTSHVGKFVSLYDLYNFDPYQGPDEHRTILDGYEPRNVERGSRIISILHSSNTVHNPYIVQMPRGNLEGTYPRALVLRYVVQLIQSCNYKDAFIIMRKHKVDLNLIVDINPILFVQVGCKQFVDQITNIDYLNLFISSLHNSDCTKTKFILPPFITNKITTMPVVDDDDEMIATQRQPVEPFDFATKTSTICQILRGIMTDSGKENSNHYYLLPILSTYAKEQPPKLDEALLLIKDYATIQFQKTRTDNGNTNKSALFSEFAQGSIRYLAFLADYELLFETSLRLYDYDMARAVARNSPKMDPKMYIPLLKRYKTMLPYYYSRYEVDIRLKHYELALRNLFHSHMVKEESIQPASPTDSVPTPIDNSFTACMKLIEQHRLHRVALELVDDKEISSDDNDTSNIIDEYKCQIMVSLGDALMNDPKLPNPNAALSVYMAIGEKHKLVYTDKAMRAARQANDWSTYFTLYLSQEQHLRDSSETTVKPTSNVVSIAHQIADELTSVAETTNNKMLYRHAARILLDYGYYYPATSTADGTASIDNGTVAITVARAVEYLLTADAWDEATRICYLHMRGIDLMPKVVDAAVSFCRATITELDDRRSILAETYPRYLEVVQIQYDAILAGEVENNNTYNQGNDDTGSVFSLASNASATSLRSTTSNASMTSTTSNSSLSSVISAKSTTSFSISGTEASLRHKSKYNQIGGGNGGKKDRSRKKRNQDKKKSKGNRKKIQLGSEEELNGLVETLTINGSFEKEYMETIANTILFLFRHQQRHLAEELYAKYNEFYIFVTNEVLTKIQQQQQNWQHQNRYQHPVQHTGSNYFPGNTSHVLASEQIVSFCKQQVVHVHTTLELPQIRNDVTDLFSFFPKILDEK